MVTKQLGDMERHCLTAVKLEVIRLKMLLTLEETDLEGRNMEKYSHPQTFW